MAYGLLVFFAFMQYTGAKPEKVDQNIPLRSWIRNLHGCNSYARIMLIVNERAGAPYLQMIAIH